MSAQVQSIAKGLREFGYPDVTPAMVQEVIDAYKAGKRDDKLPHGVLGLMIESMIERPR